MTDTLSWIHFGDLHISNEGEQNHLDFLRLIAEANRYMRWRHRLRTATWRQCRRRRS